MPVPKRKRSRARRDSRFANKGMVEGAITLCQNCKEALRPHIACTACGFYKGTKVLQTKGERVIQRSHIKAKRKRSKTVDAGVTE